MMKFKTPISNGCWNRILWRMKIFVNKFMVHLKNNHHNFVGGLFWSMLAPSWKSVAISARCDPADCRRALFHDIGKMEELEPMPHNTATPGSCWGILPLATAWCGTGFGPLRDFPRSSNSCWTILSHHGELEFKFAQGSLFHGGHDSSLGG